MQIYQSKGKKMLPDFAPVIKNLTRGALGHFFKHNFYKYLFFQGQQLGFSNLQYIKKKFPGYGYS
jgi:hypothetical protein